MKLAISRFFAKWFADLYMVDFITFPVYDSQENQANISRNTYTHDSTFEAYLSPCVSKTETTIQRQRKVPTRRVVKQYSTAHNSEEANKVMVTREKKNTQIFQLYTYKIDFTKISSELFDYDHNNLAK